MECQWRDVALVGLQMWFRHWVCQRGGNKMGAQNRADNTSIYRALPGTTLGATKVSGHSVLRPSPRLGVSKLYKCDNCLEHLK